MGERESESSLLCSPLLRCRECLPCLVLYITGTIPFQCSGSGEHNPAQSSEISIYMELAHLLSHSWSLSSINICVSLYSLKLQQGWSQATNKALNTKAEHHGGRAAREQSTMGGVQRVEHHGNRQPESRASWEQTVHDAESPPTNDSFRSGFTQY